MHLRSACHARPGRDTRGGRARIAEFHQAVDGRVEQSLAHLGAALFLGAALLRAPGADQTNHDSTLRGKPRMKSTGFPVASGSRMDLAVVVHAAP